MTPPDALSSRANAFWRPDQLLSLCRGRMLQSPGDPTASLLPPAPPVSTNTREIQPGQIFIALIGEKFDAHDFLDQAVVAGASMLIVSSESKAVASLSKLPAGQQIPWVLLVDDTVKALQAIGAAFPSGAKRVGVVGSNGKTTTRNLIATALSGAFKGTQSPKSFNNHFGVPLTLLGASVGDDFVVVEIGTNHPGEIDSLGRIVQPDAAVFTSVGQEHMEFFKTLEGVAREEAAIFPHTRAQGGLIAIQADAWRMVPPELRPADGAGGRKVVRYGKKGDKHADLTYELISTSSEGIKFKLDSGTAFSLPLIGEHNAGNALAAVAVGRWMGMTDEQIAAALQIAKPVEMRLNVSTLGNGAAAVLLINDAYNANPSSVEAAVATLGSILPPGLAGRRIAVLGDMLELGDQGPDMHRQIGRFIGQNGNLDRVVLIGRLSMFTAEALAKLMSPEKMHMFPAWDDSIPAKVAGILKPGDAVLVKASRSSKLERVVPAIVNRFG